MASPRKLKRSPAAQDRPPKRPANAELLKAVRDLQESARRGGIGTDDVERELAARKAERLSARR